MRRPGKELADAVSVGKKASEKAPGSETSEHTGSNAMTKSAGANSSSNGLVLNSVLTCNDKPEDAVEAASPLSKKSTAATLILPESVSLDRPVRSSIANLDGQMDALAVSGAANAISTLTLLGSGKGRYHPEHTDSESKSEKNSRSSTDSSSGKDYDDIYDTPDSPQSRQPSQSAKAISQMKSSRSSTTAPPSTRERKSLAAPSSLGTVSASTRERQLQKVTRRHSTNPASLSLPSADAVAMKLTSSSASVSSAALAARANRRKKISDDTSSDVDTDVDATLTLKTAVANKLDGASRTGSLRASSRRRSMML